MTPELRQWRQDGKHLPDFLKDFHDQKEVFRAVQALTISNPDDIAGKLSPVEAHCYVIDQFLWFMARHGYTLQRSRARQEFESLSDNLAFVREERSAAFAQALGAKGSAKPACAAPLVDEPASTATPASSATSPTRI